MTRISLFFAIVAAAILGQSRLWAEGPRESIPWESHPDFRAAAGLFWQNTARVKSFRAAGTCKLVTHLSASQGIAASTQTSDAEFLAVGLGSKLRLSLKYLNRRSLDPDRRELLFDGETISIASFSSNQYPTGCSLQLRQDSRHDWYGAQEASREDFRAVFRNPLMPSQDRLEQLPFRGRSASDAELWWEFASPSGLRLMYFALPGEPPLLIRHEVHRADGAPVYTKTVDWELQDGNVGVKAVTATHFKATGDIFEESEIVVSRLELNPGVTDADVTMPNLADCDATRIVDYRPNRKEAALSIPAALKEDLKQQESPAAAAEILKRLPPPRLPEAPVPSSNLAFRLILVNGILLAILGLVALVLRYRSVR